MVDYLELDTNGKVITRENKGRGRPRFGYVQATEGPYVGHWIKNGKTTAGNKVEEEDIYAPVNVKKIILAEDEPDAESLANRKTKDKRIARYNKPVTTKEHIISCMHPLSVDEQKGITVLVSPMCLTATSVVELTYNALWHRIEIDEQNNIIRVWSTYESAECNDDGKRIILPPTKIIYGALIVD